MSRKQRASKESGPKVPAYIVTFSDMVTLLLTFFVMLLSLARPQDPDLFNVGRDSFIQSIRGLGLGLLYGTENRPEFGHTKIRYFIDKPNKPFKGRTIDAKEEKIRRIFQKVIRTGKTMPSQIVAKKTDFSVTNIHFSQGDAALNEQSKKFLAKFCLDLQQESLSRNVKLYVLGLAGDEATEKKQLIVSARRAQAVAEFLRNRLTPGYKWPVYSWGAGQGGDWVGRDSPISSRSQILIAVLRADGAKY